MSLKCCSIQLVAMLLYGCGMQNYSYRALQAPQKKKISPPAGMVYVPGGSVLLGQDSTKLKKVSLSPFFMDKHEVTNAQYKQFVHWVQDSVLAHLLNEKYFFKNFSKKDGKKKINWSRINGGKGLLKSQNPRIQNKLKALLQEDGTLNPELLNYEYVSFVMDPSNPNGKKKIAKSEIINIFPNEQVWNSDFANSQNDAMVKSYFSDPLFDHHPVVGVSWKQARAFAQWRAKMFTGYTNKFINPNIIKFPMDLPTEAQWSYASELANSMLKEQKKSKEELAINFKQEEGLYNEDGATYTSHVMAYGANALGLYNLTGNVSEWTLDAYRESVQIFTHDLNPVLIYDAGDSEDPLMQQKVVKGGSWKDLASFNDPSIRLSETQNTSRSYIGFRCVMPAPELNVSARKVSISEKAPLHAMQNSQPKYSRIFKKSN